MNKQVLQNLELARFDKSDMNQHIMKMLLGCGIKFGFGGPNEHMFLEIRNITHGIFPIGHPFEKFKYYGINGFQDKMHKISMHTDHVRDTKNPCAYQ